MDVGAGKGSMDMDQGSQMELGGYGNGSGAKTLVATPDTQLVEAQKLYAEQHGGSGLPYGSAFASNTAPGSGSQAAAVAAAAAAAGAAGGALAMLHHSRNASLESTSQFLLNGTGSNENTPRRTKSDDPLLEWILKTQSPSVDGTGSKARSRTVDAVALAATAAEADAEQTPQRSGSSGNNGAALVATGATVRGTPRHRSTASKQLDVRYWQFDFRDLEIQKQIGEGSFGRVSGAGRRLGRMPGCLCVCLCVCLCLCGNMCLCWRCCCHAWHGMWLWILYCTPNASHVVDFQLSVAAAGIQLLDAVPLLPLSYCRCTSPSGARRWWPSRS